MKSNPGLVITIVASVVANIGLIGSWLIMWGKVLKRLSTMEDEGHLMAQRIDRIDELLHPDPDEPEKRMITIGECRIMQDDCQKHVHQELEGIINKLNDMEAKREEATLKSAEKWSFLDRTLGRMDTFLRKKGIDPVQ